jgi:hypothetical protein
VHVTLLATIRDVSQYLAKLCIVISFHHFSLSDYINLQLDTKQCEKIDGLEEHIPQDIQVQHAVDAWKVACQKSEDYHSRMQP